MTEEKKEPTVRQLLQAKKLAIRPDPFQRAVARILDRLFRRPVGNTARLWKRMECDDPFVRTTPKSPKAEYKGVYASGRFVRFDQLEKEKAKPTNAKDALIERLKRENERNAASNKPKAAASPSAQKPRQQPAKAGWSKISKPEPVEPTIDERRPPMPEEAKKSYRPSGRMSTRSRHRRRNVVQGGPPPGGTVPPPPAQPQKLIRPPPSRGGKRNRKKPAAEMSIEDRRPPVIMRPGDSFSGGAPRSEEAEVPAVAPEAESATANASPQEAPPPPPPKPKEPPKPPINRSPKGSSGGGLDDLFAMGGEGRVRLGRAKRPKPGDAEGDDK